MGLRDQLHQLADDLLDPAERAHLHRSIAALPEAELSDALDRLLTLRLLSPEQFGTRRPNCAQTESGDSGFDDNARTDDNRESG